MSSSWNRRHSSTYTNSAPLASRAYKPSCSKGTSSHRRKVWPRHVLTNFADALPIFDILFGTYRRPAKGEFASTGLADFPAPRSLWSAQFGPLLAVWKMLMSNRRLSSDVFDPQLP